MMKDLVSEAIVFSTMVHDGMRRRKSEMPYILHPMEVGVIIGTMTDNQEGIAAGLLHDVVEDAGISIVEIGEKFGTRVMELVAFETENKREDLPPEDTWQIRKSESLKKYLETDDDEVFRSVEEKAMVIGYMRLLRRSVRRPDEKDSVAMVVHSKEILAYLLNKVDTLVV